jgi:hypothetical protein
MWVNYHSIDSRGFICNNFSQREIYVIEDEYIRCFSIDENGMPWLQNVMVNFLQANMILFGGLGSFAIIYKQSHKDFSIFKKMLSHDFKSIVNNENFEGAIGLNVDIEDWFIVAKNGCLLTYEDVNYRQKFQIDLQLEKTDTREPFEILSICISKDSEYIAIIIGKQLIRDEELITKLMILNRITDRGVMKGQFGIMKEINRIEKGMTDVCKRIHFDLR